MAGLKELRTRIDAIKSTQKITSAMKMVAASRLRRVQILVDKNFGYSENLRKSALRVMMEIENEEETKGVQFMRPLLLQQKKNPTRYTLCVISSDRGLCGAYNSNIAKRAAQRIRELQKAGKEITVACIGKKAYDILRRYFSDSNIILNRVDNNYRGLTYADMAHKLSDEILKQFIAGEFDVCEFVYADFKTAISRTYECEQVCPLELNTEHLNDEQLQLINRSGNAFYEYLPDKLTLLTEILPILFNDNLFKIVVNSAASEHSARMTSMDSATRNAKKMISELTLKYNSLRQSAITTELIEIIAGAEAI
ncbi:MAG: ATP synthase F1 subunit gamma [Alphaproteobacteria bacterium]|nr:ATP synthase F1 subunit gamma [Alphaproteobacteria bacterium]